jgi:transcriptional regulator with XRE-family HTH domain
VQLDASRERVYFAAHMSTREQKRTNALRPIREERGLTLKEFATILGSTESHLSKVERGLIVPHGITQARWARLIGVDRNSLFPAERAEVAS